MEQIQKGMAVKWTLRSGDTGTGTVISEPENGHCLVAIETQTNKEQTSTDNPEMHWVIYCATTWLTPIIS